MGLVPLGHVRQQAAEQGSVHHLIGSRLPARPQARLAAGKGQLEVYVAPLPHTQVGEKLALAELAQLVLAQCLALFLVVIPERCPGQEVRALMPKATVFLIGGLLLVHRALPRVLDAQRTGNNQHLREAACLVARQEHPGESRVDRQLRHTPPQLRQRSLGVHGGKFLQ